MNARPSAKQMQLIAWGVSLTVTALAVIAWGQSYDWQFSPLTSYKVFPLFGLLAFSLMWGHYIVSALRQYWGLRPRVLSEYFEITSAVVLAAILLHPGVFLWQLWQDGFGLPPGSAKVYVGAAAYWAIWLAIIAWTAFIAYEFRRVYGKKRWWPVVQYTSDVAMFLIFIHALRLGGALQLGWFRGVWIFYGVTLGFVMLQTYILKLRHSK